MKNCVQQSGVNVTVAAAPYTVDSGEGVLVGSLFGVAASDAENGAEVVIVTQGVFDLAKDSDSVFIVGGRVWFESDNQVCRSDSDSDSAGGSDAEIGVCVQAAGAGTTTVRVRLGVGVPLV